MIFGIRNRESNTETFTVVWVRNEFEIGQEKGNNRGMAFLASFIFIYFMYMGVLPACMYVLQVHIWCLWRSEHSARFPRTGVTFGCEPPYEWWESSQGPLQEQQALLTTEPSL